MTTHAIHPTGVKLEATIKARLQKLGKIKHRTIHWLMKEAISNYVEHEEKAEALKQETLDRWHNEAEQNKVVSNESVMDWLDTWGTDNETGRPPCKK
ncbi:MAG: CopG family transcriptional regulator [Gammaproteobacteria bacterium]|nr:CopG family transcriptional regulator [Gammaproteobacteria bacterium]